MTRVDKTIEGDVGAPIPPHGLRSVTNALEILLYLQEGHEVSVSDVANHIGVGMSTAHRLLTTLKAQSFARQSRRTRRYLLGPALSIITSTRMIEDLIEAARVPMRQLVDATGETGNLMVRDNRSVRYIHFVDSPHLVRLGFHLESTLPLNAMAGGKVLIAHLSKHELLQLFPTEAIQQTTRFTIDSRTRLLEELTLVKKQGYAFGQSEAEEGLFVAAVPVHDKNGYPVAAISLGGPIYRLDAKVMLQKRSERKSNLEVMLDAAKATARNLGIATPDTKPTRTKA